MRVVPLTLSQANELVTNWHRHHKPCVGHRFSLGAIKRGETLGAAVTGRPVSRELPQYEVAEVNRLVSNGDKNVCSFLYAACARVAKEMGFIRIQTYILDSEPGTSLKAAGWHRIKSDGSLCEHGNSFDETDCTDCRTTGGNWNHGHRKGRREDQPMCIKQRWGKDLNEKEKNMNLEEKLAKAASKETSADPEKWTAENPLYGHCAIASLVVQDVLGGTLKNGRQGSLSHYWNILPDGAEVDYTKAQFSEAPVWDTILLTKQRDYVLSFPATAERYAAFKTRFEAAV